jgi:predicted kinase
MSKVLYLVRGLPGSGKSTMARKLVKPEFVFEADNYFINDEGEYKFDRSNLRLAHKDCFKDVHNHLSTNRQDAAVANTFTQRWELQPYIAIARLFGWYVEILETSTEWAKNPNECVKKCIHGVPLDVIVNMKDRWEPTQFSWYV